MTSNVTTWARADTPPGWEEPQSGPGRQTVNADSEGCLQSHQGDFVPWDNPHNIVSKETEFWISMTISVGGIPLLWVVGAVGNSLSGAVFYRQGLGSRINLCLFCLALADLVSVTVLFLLYAEGAHRMLLGPAHFFITYFVGLTGFSLVSQLLSVVIACERCFCVVSPLKAQRFVSTRKMAAFLGVTSLLLVGGFLAVVGAKHTTACVIDPLTNVTTEIVYVTSYYLDNQEILDIFDVFVFSTALPAIFLIVITVTTVLTASKLHSAVKWRHQTVRDVTTSTESKKPTSGVNVTPTTDPTKPTKKAQGGVMTPKEVALTRTLVATSVLYVLCLTPSLLVQVATFLVEDLRYNGHYHNFITVLWALVSLCKVLNSSLNFFVYYAMGSRFRDTLHELFACTSRSDETGSRAGVHSISGSRSFTTESSCDGSR